jgi:hypothetical protein
MWPWGDVFVEGEERPPEDKYRVSSWLGLVDLVRFEPTICFMPWSRDASLVSRGAEERELQEGGLDRFGPRDLFCVCLDLVVWQRACFARGTSRNRAKPILRELGDSSWFSARGGPAIRSRAEPGSAMRYSG